MTGAELRQNRDRLGWTQQDAASKLGVSQPYLSLLELGQRAVSKGLAKRAATVYRASPTQLPLSSSLDPFRSLDPRVVAQELAGLGYPGFSHLRSKRRVNPAGVLFETLSQSDLEARLVEALPWVILRYPDLSWGWLVPRTKLHNLQNRLGYVTKLAGQLAEVSGNTPAAAVLKEKLRELGEARLASEGTLCHDSLPPSERAWLRANRPPEAKYWNLLTDLRSDHLPYDGS